MFNGSGGNPFGNMNNNGAMGNVIGNLINSEEGMNLLGGMLKNGGGSNGIILIVLAFLLLGFGRGFNQIGNKGCGCNSRSRCKHHHKHHKRYCSSGHCNMN